MHLPRFMKWLASALLALLLLAAITVVLVGWNWLRAPIERMAFEKTGRTLVIGGDLEVHWGWPWPRIQAQKVSFSNPPWTIYPHLLTADAVAFSVHAPQLLTQKWVLSDLHLTRPIVHLELGSEGRKNWLLDPNQQDASARVDIDRLTLDQGVIGYDDKASHTSIRTELSTLPVPTGSTADPGVSFSAQGQFNGLSLKASGTGDTILTMRNETTPYGLTVDGTVGHTRIQATGHVTSLVKLVAIDMQLTLSGNNLNQLFTLTGIAMPATRDYVMQGHLVRQADTLRYAPFTGRMGSSDLAGWVQVKTGGKRPVLTGDLVSTRLTLEDLGPVIGAREDQVQNAKNAATRIGPVTASTPRAKRVIPDLPFNAAQWNSVDAQVNFSAKSIRRAADAPLESLVTHISLKDSVLTLDPLQFAFGRGQINAVVTLDGRHNPIQTHAQVQATRLALSQWLPTNTSGNATTSLMGGKIVLAGSGNSVGTMLAGSSGSVKLLVSGGDISQMMMEKAGLHLWEIFRLSLTGDKQIKLRCAVANFDVKAGQMRANTLLLDTQVTTLLGSGSIDLAQEKFDLTISQKTKNTSPLALRSPIHVGGNFALPIIKVDQGRLAGRALGAVALGIINPLLMLLPLIDPGPGADSDCAQWLQGKP
ncbi:MAG: AsmA family protein [Sideroxydans sp.]|nr:AsmA family protein [Sideroxydans sp.]